MVVPNELREKLQKLYREGVVVAIKSGTEIEDMSISEMYFLRELTRGSIQNAHIPLIIKTGGPEARQDMRMALRLSVDVILAPMIESVYALENFVKSAKEIMEEEGRDAELAINLETGLAVENLNDMILSRSFAELAQVTIGRGDLSRSMHLEVDDNEVLEITTAALKKIRNSGKRTSVGGGIKLASIEMISRRLPTERFNTRHVTMENSPEFRKNPVPVLQKALNFELDLYDALRKKFPERKEYYKKRMAALQDRLEKPLTVRAV